MFKRKKFWIILSLSFLLLFIIVSTFAFKVYHILPNSTSVFRIKHNTFSHLYFYTSGWSYSPGDTVSVFGSSSEGSEIEVTLSRVNDPDKVVFSSQVEFPFNKIKINGADEAGKWKESIKIPLDEAFFPGWYLIKAKDKNAEWRSSIFIHPKKEKRTHKLAYVFPTNTWAAYNFWGGQSTYTRSRTKKVSFLRPTAAGDPLMTRNIGNHPLVYHSANIDKLTLDLLDSLEIGYDVYCDEDFEGDQSWMCDYEAIVIANHSEYWSSAMFYGLKEYLDRGGSFICLSGNTAFWPAEIDTLQHTMAVNKMHGNSWVEKDSLLAGSIGVNGILFAMHTYAPYEVLVDTCWVLKGTGLKVEDQFGMKSEIYDNTIYYTGIFKKLFALFQTSGSGAASGLEVDKVFSKTPDNWVTVASGMNPMVFGKGEVYPDPAVEWDGKGGADLGYYNHPGGGFVFNAGSLAFPGAITHDPNVRKILQNVFEYAIQK